MDWLPTLDRILPWHWWVLGAVLLILEVAAPGVFFVWLALAAFTLGLLVFVLPLSVPLQLLLFAALSVAAVLVGRRYVSRLALGGTAHKPWRAAKAEAALKGQPATAEAFRTAIEAELANAKTGKDNAFKVPMLRNTVVAVLEELRDGTTARRRAEGGAV